MSDKGKFVGYILGTEHEDFLLRVQLKAGLAAAVYGPLPGLALRFKTADEALKMAARIDRRSPLEVLRLYDRGSEWLVIQ
jgi:hypothetical protein